MGTDLGDGGHEAYPSTMSEAEPLFAILLQSADASAAAAIDRLVREASDRELCRVNALAFAAREGIDEKRNIAAFLKLLISGSEHVACQCGSVISLDRSSFTWRRGGTRCSN